MQLTPSQLGALDLVLKAQRKGEKVIKLNGPAGTGKTTMLLSMVDEMGDCVVVTPTNRAAAVLRAKGIGASTTYKIFFTPEDYMFEGKKRVRFTPNYEIHSSQLASGKLKYSPVIIVDEASMLNSSQVAELRQMCDTLVLVGDEFQLPPVGDKTHPNGYFNAVKATASLTEVLRQEGNSSILRVATELRRKNPGWRALVPELGMVAMATREMYADDTIRYIAPTHKTRIHATNYVRETLGHTDPLPQYGEPIIVKENINDDFYNGAAATVLSCQASNAYPGLIHMDIQNELGAVIAVFVEPWCLYNHPDESIDLKMVPAEIEEMRKEFDRTFKSMSAEELSYLANKPRVHFGHVMTCHESQGSEWDDVVIQGSYGDVVGAFGRARPDQPRVEHMVERWYYTAVTRARKSLRFVSVVAPV